MLVPYRVVETQKKNEFELAKIMDDAVNMAVAKCLIFDKNECQRERLNNSVYKNQLSEIKDVLNKIDEKSKVIESNWKETIEKKSVREVREHIGLLRSNYRDCRIVEIRWCTFFFFLCKNHVFFSRSKFGTHQTK